MHPEFLDRSVDHNRSVSVTRYFNKELIKIWHYHEQIEIVGIISNSGTRFVGDNIEKYESGDIVIIGENLPHMWQNDTTTSETELNSEVVAIHLGNVFTHTALLELPEYANAKKLIQLSKQGIVFHNATDSLTKIGKLHTMDSFNQLMTVMDIMHDLGNNPDYELLTSKGFVEKVNDQNEGRLQHVHDYVMNNFKHQISLVQASDVANMNSSSFSRYFKQKYGKNFSQYVNEIRIGYACKLLLKDQYSITEVCFESGFNNISNFNKQFKTIHSISPKEYKRKFKS